MSVLARVLRQFREGTDATTLEKVLVLPDVPTMGRRLDLRTEGVEALLTVGGVTLRPIADEHAVRPPNVDVLLLAEPLASRRARQDHRLARSGATRRLAGEDPCTQSIRTTKCHQKA